MGKHTLKVFRCELKVGMVILALLVKRLILVAQNSFFKKRKKKNQCKNCYYVITSENGQTHFEDLKNFKTCPDHFEMTYNKVLYE